MSLVVVAPIDGIQDEFDGRDWPLHVTVTTNFETSLNADDVIDRIAACAVMAPFTAVPGADRQFGPDLNIPVVLIHSPDEFAELHHTLVEALDGTVEWLTPQYLRENYRPHCTVIRGRRMSAAAIIDRLVLVDNAPDGDPSRRRVLGRVSLG